MIDKTTFFERIREMAEKAKKDGNHRTLDARKLSEVFARLKAKKEANNEQGRTYRND